MLRRSFRKPRREYRVPTVRDLGWFESLVNLQLASCEVLWVGTPDDDRTPGYGVSVVVEISSDTLIAFRAVATKAGAKEMDISAVLRAPEEVKAALQEQPYEECSIDLKSFGDLIWLENLCFRMDGYIIDHVVLDAADRALRITVELPVVLRDDFLQLAVEAGAERVVP